MTEENQIDNHQLNTNKNEEENSSDTDIPNLLPPWLNWDIITQVFERSAFLNDDYHAEQHLKFYPNAKMTLLKSIDDKFEDISNYLWDTSNPQFHKIEKYRKLNGRELREYYKDLSKFLMVNELGLPPMVSLPLRRGQDVSQKKLNRAISYRDAMNVFGDDNIVSYKGIDHNKAIRKMVFMYVEELRLKNELKQTLKVERETCYFVGEYRSLETKLHRIMDYTDKKNELRKKNAALFLEACLVPTENENENETENYF
jgi:hypothetical protein